MNPDNKFLPYQTTLKVQMFVLDEKIILSWSFFICTYVLYINILYF